MSLTTNDGGRVGVSVGVIVGSKEVVVDGARE